MDSLDVKVARIEKHVEQMEKQYEKALTLQAKEYERRLADLNHEAEQLRQMQATYLPRETWELALGKIEESLKELRAFKDNAVGRQVIYAFGIPAIIAWIVSVLVR